MGPSSQSTQSAVVQSTAPWAAYQAGQYGVQAANEASQLAAQGTNNALNAINTQYQAASTALRPTQQVGVQAMDALNQYIGLQPYMPIAPTAPTIGRTDINNYVSQNYKLSAGMQGPGNNSGGSVEGPPDNNAGANSQPTMLHPQYTGYVPTTGVTFGPVGKSSNVNPNSSGLESVIYNGVGTNLAYSTGTGDSGQAGSLPVGYYNSDFRSSNNDFGYSSLSTDPTIQDWVKQGIMADPSSDPSYKAALDSYKIDSANYAQDQGWAQQYGTPLTSSEVTDKITNLPGYQAQLKQGTQAINADAAAKGYLGSGAMLKSLMSFGQNTMSQFYGNTLNQLAQVAGAGSQAAGQQAQLAGSTGNALAGLYQNLGNTQANSALSAGNSLSQAIIAANQQFHTIQTGQSSSSSGMDMSGIGSLIGMFGKV